MANEDRGVRIKLQMPNEVENSREPATVCSIYCEIGDEVEVGESLVEMLNPDRIFDISAPVSGRVEQILVKEGQLVRGGQTLVVIHSDSAGSGGT